MSSFQITEEIASFNPSKEERGVVFNSLKKQGKIGKIDERYKLLPEWLMPHYRAGKLWFDSRTEGSPLMLGKGPVRENGKGFRAGDWIVEDEDGLPKWDPDYLG